MGMDKTSYKNFVLKNGISLTAGLIAFSVLLTSGGTKLDFYKGGQIINAPFSNGNVVGKDDIEINEVTEEIKMPKDIPSSFESLKSAYYTVDKRTELLPTDIDVEKFENMELSIDNSISGPKILIFHTHSNEGYADSDGTLEDGIWGVGEELKNHLEDMLGVEVMHDTGRYDIVNGKGQVLGAYERMEPSIQKILDENPSIQMVIDMHRDGVAEGTRLVTEIDGKKCAKIMFFNGICRLNEGGTLKNLTYLPNPYIEENLALSFKLQSIASNYNGLTRKIYINAYRYSLHMKPLSMLVEVGAQTNTKEEAKNSMLYLAKSISQVITIK